MIKIRHALTIIGWIGAMAALFTVVASGFLLYLNNSIRFFTLPFNQWWSYLFLYWGHWNIQAWTKILTSGIIGLMIPVLILKLAWQRGAFFLASVPFATRTGGHGWINDHRHR